MGASISKLFSGLIWGKKDIRILILGLVGGQIFETAIFAHHLDRTMPAKPHCYTDSK
jgi:hypothetical protein